MFHEERKTLTPAEYQPVRISLPLSLNQSVGTTPALPNQTIESFVFLLLNHLLTLIADKWYKERRALI